LRNAHERLMKNICLSDKFRGMTAEVIYNKLDDEFCKQFQVFDELMDGDSSGEQNWERIVKAAKTQGRLPSGWEEILEGTLKPKVDWKRVLAEFIIQNMKCDFRWLPPSRRSADYDFIFPSLRSEGCGEIVIAIDTSGSISSAEAKQFYSEVLATFRSYPMTLHIIQCDSKVHSHDVYRFGDNPDFSKIKIHGRGGTDFRPVFKELGFRPQVLIYLTDGDGTYPRREPDYPVIWVLSQPRQVPWGRTLVIDTPGEN